jgi:hypothetical protein
MWIYKPLFNLRMLTDTLRYDTGEVENGLYEPLRKLTVKNAHFRWTNDEECAFNNVKRALTKLWHILIRINTELTTDASPWGLSAILLQRMPGTRIKKLLLI